jgi:phage gp29-like protein
MAKPVKVIRNRQSVASASTADKAVSQTPGGGKSVEQLIRAANKWRDFYNVLRGLTVARVVLLIERAQYGDTAELQLLMDKTERRYPVCKALKSRRQSALGKLSKEWDVKILEQLPDGATPAMAAAQQKFLKNRYNLVTNLRQTIRFLMLAEFRGYSVLQKRRYDGGAFDGAVSEFYWLPQDQIARDGKYGDFFYNEKSMFGATGSTLGEINRIGGAQLPRTDFLIREVESPLFEIILFAFINWLMARKDNAAFVEIFGLPNAFVIMPPNIPTGQEEKYKYAAEKIAEGVSGAVPAGGDVKFPTASVRNNGPFKEFCDAQDEDVVLAGTGGKLTMLTGPVGLGGGQSKVHQDSFAEIAVEDGEDISEIFQRDFDRVELAEAFPGQPVCVYFTIAPTDEEDADKIADTVVKLEGVGLQTDAKEISERTGFTLTRVALPPANPAAQKDVAAELGDAVKNRLAKILNRAGIDPEKVSPVQAAALYTAVNADLKPLRDRLAVIDKISDPVIQREKLIIWKHDVDQLKPDILADSHTARALEGIIAENLKTGLTEKTEATKA